MKNNKLNTIWNNFLTIYSDKPKSDKSIYKLTITAEKVHEHFYKKPHKFIKTSAREFLLNELKKRKINTSSSRKVFYVYKVTDSVTGEFYIGHRGSAKKPEYDNYLGSPVVWNPIRKRLKKEIIEIFQTRVQAKKYESELIRKHWSDKLNRNFDIPNDNSNKHKLEKQKKIDEYFNSFRKNKKVKYDITKCNKHKKIIKDISKFDTINAWRYSNKNNIHNKIKKKNRRKKNKKRRMKYRKFSEEIIETKITLPNGKTVISKHVKR